MNDDISDKAGSGSAVDALRSAGEPEATDAKRPYVAPPQHPTQSGSQGIRFDFNAGARVLLPERSEGSWRVRVVDLDTGSVLFQSENKGALVLSSKQFYVRFGIDVWDVDASGKVVNVLSHAYDARGRDVLIQLPVGTLGDTLGWFPYVARFAEERGARVVCSMSALIIPLFRDAYPHIRLITPEEAANEALQRSIYASYYIGLFFDDKDAVRQPCDFRFVGLHRTAGYILGVDPAEAAPRLSLPDESRPIPEPYVCIATQATSQAKYWNNPYGWRELVAFFKANGYRVICIDQKPVHGTGIVWNHIPSGAEDYTGDHPLVERARWLRHADCFVGLSSGLTWLAWSAGTPVVLISGFTHPTTEFSTPSRVINWHACNSCWNDAAHRFDHFDFLWCPRHANTPRQFECTRLIAATQVIGAVRKIPGFETASWPAATEGSI